MLIGFPSVAMHIKLIVVLTSLGSLSASSIEYSPSTIVNPSTVSHNQLYNEKWTVESCVSGVVQRAEERKRNCPCRPEDVIVFGELSIIRDGRVSCCQKKCEEGDTPLTTSELTLDAQFCCEGVRRLLIEKN
ncbi:hypothetical protein PRIPAC_95456 [Pristionchus pacificus]|uniref:Uncharacterized protein n=1 Tax=Pristionchus pacificus TaxID=54126 RepID=A0A454XUL9_PRIPA|nr:hypothetical protein PRIPAC_95456 [Pristionchus pacificus]|eukprot:PDM63876.1 hypothetical protein PRIPAC_49849 [Pristionchus pacificus]